MSEKNWEAELRAITAKHGQQIEAIGEAVTMGFQRLDKKIDDANSVVHREIESIRQANKPLGAPAIFGIIGGLFGVLVGFSNFVVAPGDVKQESMVSAMTKLEERLDEHKNIDGHPWAIAEHAKHAQRFETIAESLKAVDREIRDIKGDLTARQEWMMGHDATVSAVNANQTTRIDSIETAIVQLDTTLQREMRLLDDRQTEQIANLDQRLQREMVDKLEPLRVLIGAMTDRLKVSEGHVKQIIDTRFSKQDAELLIKNGE